MKQERTIDERMGTSEQRTEVLHHVSQAIAHDLRTPLTLMLNALQLLKTSADATDESREYVEMITVEVAAINRMLDQWCDITSSRPTELARASLLEMIQRAFSHADPRGRVSLHLDGIDETSFIWCHPEDFVSLLGHLFGNAVRATKGRGTLGVSFRSEPDHDVIEVVDSGPGVPDEIAVTLFEPFVSTRRGGMGLGLTYCRVIAGRLGGTVDLVRTSESGSVFRVSLPRT